MRFAFVLFAALAVQRSCAEKPNFEDMLAKVKEAAAANKADEMVQGLQNIVKEYPEKPDGYHHLSLLHLKAEKLADAEQVLRSMVKAGVASATHFNNLGICLMKQGSHKDAQEFLVQGIEKAPAGKVKAALLFTLGNAFVEGAKAADKEGAAADSRAAQLHALQAYSTALEEDPDHKNAAANMKVIAASVGVVDDGKVTVAQELRIRTSDGVLKAYRGSKKAVEAADSGASGGEGVAM